MVTKDRATTVYLRKFIWKDMTVHVRMAVLSEEAQEEIAFLLAPVGGNA